MKSRAKTRYRGLTARKTELQGVLGKNQGFMCKNQKVLRADVQKDLNWTAGSILKKLRGVHVRFWAELQILLNGTGLRVDSQELQGLFSKSGRPNWYL